MARWPPLVLQLGHQRARRGRPRGESEVIGPGGGGSGWAANWLPDGRTLITGADLIRVEPGGSRVRHADLSHISPHGWSEITVDGRGNIYVNTINFDWADFNDLLAGGEAPGKIAFVTPDGEAREVADDLAFPNGMVVTADNATLIVAESFARRLTAFDIAADGSLTNRRVWADVTGDGICLDAEGAVWCSDVGPDEGSVCLRVRERGEVLDRIEAGPPVLRMHAGRRRWQDALHGGGEVVRSGQDRRAAADEDGPDPDGPC
jgi:sugar lactone lactonase YvrE